jgi:hypothetical protein
MTRTRKSNTWNAIDLDWDESSLTDDGEPTMFSLHFLRSALRRRRLLIRLSVLIGLALSAAWLVVEPGQHQASVVLVMTHEPGVDTQVAQATDVRLATARPVALATVGALRLSERPENFLRSVTAIATTGDILTLTLTAGSDREAVRRLSALTAEFLRFRAQELNAQANLQLRGMNIQIGSLQQEADDLSKQADALPSDASARRAELITLRAKIMARVQELQESVQDTTLQTAAQIGGSRVIDAVDVLPSGGKRRIVLGLAPGLIGGSALGIGIVLFLAVTSDRLRRRLDVATALEAPVLISTGRIRPVPRWLRPLPTMRRRNDERTADRKRVASVIETALPEPGRGQWLVVGCVDNSAEVHFAVVETAQNLLQNGYVVHLIDLTEAGRLPSTVAKMDVRHAPGQLTVSQPRVMAALASDLSDVQTVGIEPGQELPWNSEDVFLTVSDLGADATADHLSSWADLVVVAVTAGRSTAARLRGAAESLTAADLEICAAVLLRAESGDESSGYPPEQVGVSPGAQHLSPV